MQLIFYWTIQSAGLLRLELVIDFGNLASYRVADKARARREDTLRNWELLHGTLHDAAMFSFNRTKDMVSLGPQSKSNPGFQPAFLTVVGGSDHKPPRLKGRITRLSFF